MGIRAAKRDAQSALLELVRHGLGVLDRLGLQLLELFGLRELEGERQGREDMDVRSALFAGEDGFIDLLGNGRVGGQQHRPAWTIETLVGGGHHHMRDANRRRHDTRRDQPADMRNICQEVRAHFIGDLAEFLPIGNPGIGGIPGDDQFRFGLERLRTDLVVVELLVFIHGVMHGLEPLPRAVDRRSV